MSAHDASPPATPSFPRAARVTLLVLALLVAVFVIVRLIGHFTDEHSLKNATEANATQIVNVITPRPGNESAELDLPGNIQAFEDTPIYARTNGYLQHWYADLGARVRKGDLMATIETPELDEQLATARADLKSAEADLNLANTTSARYQNLFKEDSVSKQETDVAVSGAAAKKAAVDAQQANVRRLEQLQSFEKVYAPYDGVVTQRNTEVGDLIVAGATGSSGGSNTGGGRELFHIASTQKLRVFVPVPEAAITSVHTGDIATLTVDEYPGQTFTGTVTRNSSAVDPSSRTLNVQIDVNNADGRLLPGSYVVVHFKVPAAVRLLNVPANAMLFRSEGMQVATVENGHIHLKRITVGHDYGKSIDVSSGLGPNDQVILDPSDSVEEGQPVKIAPKAAAQ